LVTSSPADRARTSTMSKARLPNGTGTPCVRSSRRVRSISHGPGSSSNRRRCAANPLTPLFFWTIFEFFRITPRNGCARSEMIAHREVSHVIPILARSRPRHLHSHGMLDPDRRSGNVSDKPVWRAQERARCPGTVTEFRLLSPKQITDT